MVYSVCFPNLFPLLFLITSPAFLQLQFFPLKTSLGHTGFYSCSSVEAVLARRRPQPAGGAAVAVRTWVSLEEELPSGEGPPCEGGSGCQARPRAGADGVSSTLCGPGPHCSWNLPFSGCPGGGLTRFHPEGLGLRGGAPPGQVSLVKLWAGGGMTCCLGSASWGSLGTP